MKWDRVRDDSGTVGSREITKVPGTLTYDVTFRAWDSYAYLYVGTIFPVYRKADGSYSHTRRGWEVSGSDATFKTLDAAADFLALRHLSDEALNVRSTDPVTAGMHKAAQEMSAAGVAKDGRIPFGMGWASGLAARVKEAPLALPEYASGPYCTDCGGSVVGNDPRYFRPGAGWYGAGNYCPTCYHEHAVIRQGIGVVTAFYRFRTPGGEPNPERAHLQEMAAEFGRQASIALDYVAQLAPDAMKMANGTAPTHADAMLDLADQLASAANTLGWNVRYQNQCWVRLGDVPMTPSDIADWMGECEPEYPEPVADPMSYEPYPVAEYYGWVPEHYAGA